MTINPTKSTLEPQTVQNIQSEIARLDRLLIFYLARRLQYSERVQQLSPQDNQAEAIGQFKTLLNQRQNWAISAGLNPNFVRKLAHYLIDYYLTEALGSRD